MATYVDTDGAPLIEGHVYTWDAMRDALVVYHGGDNFRWFIFEGSVNTKKTYVPEEAKFKHVGNLHTLLSNLETFIYRRLNK